MQGWKNKIPTQKKIEYINALLKVGFDTIDFGRCMLFLQQR
jgi:hydroxymethylglutaryl-CoA lyase